MTVFVLTLLDLLACSEGIFEVVNFLNDTCPRAILSLSMCCKTTRAFITSNIALRSFWHTQLLRTSHKPLHPSTQLLECYRGKNVKSRDATLKLQKNKDYARTTYGECTNDGHLTIKSPNQTRPDDDIYRTWKLTAYNRVKKNLWNNKLERKMKRLSQEVVRLEKKKQLADQIRVEVAKSMVRSENHCTINV
jgi:hypothetical protein